jgi:hypothetical protein
MFRLQEIDQIIAGAALITILDEPEAVDGIPKGGSPIPIQFPPRIRDDSKTANWQENDVASYEPYAIWVGAGARKISVELQYIVTGNGDFTAKGIAEIARAFKGYFYRGIQEGQAIPLVTLNIYEHMGGDTANFRMYDVSVTHGDTLIRDESSGGVFPLLTTIKFNAALATNIGAGGKIEGAQDIPNLEEKPLKAWY